MATVSHSSDIALSGSGLVFHGSDCLLDSRRWDRFVPLESSASWTRWTVDSTRDFDRVFTSPMRGDDQVEAIRLGYVPYVATAGNYLHTRAASLSNASGSVPYETLWGWGGIHPSPSSSNYEPTVGENYLEQFATWVKTGTLGILLALYSDSNGDVYQIVKKSLHVAVVAKLNQSTNGFEAKATYTLTDWDTNPKGLVAWRAVMGSDDKLHIVWMLANTNSSSQEVVRYAYSRYDTSTSTFDVTEEVIKTPNGVDKFVSSYAGLFDIVVRSTGEVVVWHPGDDRTQGTSNGPQFSFSRRTGTDTWVESTWTNSETNWITRFDAYFRCVVGANDRIHFFYNGYNGTGYSLFHRSLSSSNVLDTEHKFSHSVYNDATFLNSSIASVDVGIDTYIYFATLSTTFNDTIIIRAKSEAGPTFSVTTNPDTGGLSDSMFEGVVAVDVHWPGTLLPTSDGYMNLVRFRNHYVYTVPTGTSGSRAVRNGSGMFVYTDKAANNTFSTLRDWFGRVNFVPGETATIDNWKAHANSEEWPWPFLGYNNGAEKFAAGIITKGTTEYMYVVIADYNTAVYPYYGETGYGRVFYLKELKDIPIITVQHTSDTILRPKPIHHTSDTVLVLPGSSPVVDHTSDLVMVNIGQETHSSDMLSVDRATVTHTTDTYLSSEVILTGSSLLSFTSTASYELVLPADITGENDKKYRHGIGKWVKKG